jgi:hypothetical protein
MLLSAECKSCMCRWPAEGDRTDERACACVHCGQAQGPAAVAGSVGHGAALARRCSRSRSRSRHHAERLSKRSQSRATCAGPRLRSAGRGIMSQAAAQGSSGTWLHSNTVRHTRAAGWYLPAPVARAMPPHQFQNPQPASWASFDVLRSIRATLHPHARCQAGSSVLRLLGQHAGVWTLSVNILEKYDWSFFV